MFSRVTCIVITIATRLHCLLLLLFSWVVVTRVWQYKDVVTSLVLLLVRNNVQEAAALPPVYSPASGKLLASFSTTPRHSQGTLERSTRAACQSDNSFRNSVLSGHCLPLYELTLIRVFYDFHLIVSREMYFMNNSTRQVNVPVKTRAVHWPSRRQWTQKTRHVHGLCLKPHSTQTQCVDCMTGAVVWRLCEGIVWVLCVICVGFGMFVGNFVGECVCECVLC